MGELCSCMVYSVLFACAGAVFAFAADRRKRTRLFWAAGYLSYCLKNRRVEPYRPPKGVQEEPFAFAVCILFGTAAALYYPIVW